MLKSLVIKNFRSLEDFQVKKLGRVNLIVGKNNSGKSSVLEALRIYAGNANQELLVSIAREHDEKHYLDDEELDAFNDNLPFEAFFTGRKFSSCNRCIVIGEIENTASHLEIEPGYIVEEEVTVIGEAKETTKRIRRVPVQKHDFLDGYERVGDALLVRKDSRLYVIDFEKLSNRAPLFSSNKEEKKILCSLIPTQFISMDELGKEWDAIALTEGEKIVTEALRIIMPEIDGLTFVVTNVSNRFRTSNREHRLAKVKISSLSHPVPLGSLGDGMLRILQLVLKIFAARGGFLLIDEFENGLHYSVQDKVWRLLFELSIKLDIQIFATTHSWDCIESFAKVAVDNQDIDGVLFRVSQSVRTSDRGRVIATLFEKEQLFSITQSDVEVR